MKKTTCKSIREAASGKKGIADVDRSLSEILKIMSRLQKKLPDETAKARSKLLEASKELGEVRKKLSTMTLPFPFSS